jgi:hypothetical protein
MVAIGALALLFAALCTWLSGRGILKRSTLIDERIWALGLLAIFVSDWMNRPWGLFGGPSIRGEILIAFAVMFWSIRTDPERGSYSWIAPGINNAAGVVLLPGLQTAHSFSPDDHAMFIFRLKLLRENFPSIPFWSPLWNAGFDARDFFATGALNVFLLAAPLVSRCPD